jgi:hypothetical protein
MFSHIEMYPERKQVCSSCKGNTFSVNGGFLIDAKMDDQDHLQAKIAKHFKIFCQHLNFEDNSLSEDCETWSSTGNSLKTPQGLKAQADQGISQYVISYSDTFLYNGMVEFRYRANTMISGNVTNGLFAFYVDGVNQNVVSDHLMSGMWIPI